MAKDAPSMVKNKMRRCFQAVIEPHPSKSDIDSLWEYFDSSCAYCGVKIDRGSRTGHVDHVVSSAAGGSNDIHMSKNFVHDVLARKVVYDVVALNR